MTEPYIRTVLEAAMLAAGRPLQLAEFAQLFEEGARPTNAEMRTALKELEAEY
jgi:segregation and condensation protein B